MPNRPTTVLLDVNETLSDLSPLAARWEAAGAPPGLWRVWFASLLRDGFALAVTGEAVGMADLGRERAAALLAEAGVADPAGTAAGLVAAVADLPLHPDVAPGLRSLKEGGLRVATLTNGSAEVARSLLGSAGLLGDVDELLSVEAAGVWKPAPGAYRWALDHLGVAAGATVLAAVHPWDLHGAARVGLSTAWVNRTGAPWAPWWAPPTWEVEGFEGLAGVLAALPA